MNHLTSYFVVTPMLSMSFMPTYFPLPNLSFEENEESMLTKTFLSLVM